MNFTFAEVDGALAAAHGIASAKRNAFRARLQHFQKLGFPEGLNTGRGRAAVYNPGHIILLGIALELGQLGLTPERAKAVISDDMHATAMAVAMAARGDFAVLLRCDPTALKSLTIQEGVGDFASASFFYAGLGQAVLEFESMFSAGMRRMAYFSVSALIEDLTGYLATPHVTAPMICEALEAWASPFIHDDKPAGQ